MSGGGGMPPGYNPHAVGAMSQAGGGAGIRLFGVVGDANAGDGLGLQKPMQMMQAPRAGLNTMMSDKGPRSFGKLLQAVGMRIKPIFEGFQNLRSANIAEIQGSGANVGMGELGTFSPPVTPGMSRGVGGPGLGA